MAKLTLSIGSNVGDRQRLLGEAREEIVKAIGPLLYAGEVIATKAWGQTEQADFLNQVVTVEVPNLPADLTELLDKTQAIERRLGRERKTHWGPRTIDIDLIFLDDVRYEDERLSLPHPWWRVRRFVTDLLPPDLAFNGYFGIDDGRQ